MNTRASVWAFLCVSAQVVMLYVDEETSIKRQMERAKMAFMHNRRVMDAGAGELW
jgi:hypothetical protein